MASINKSISIAENCLEIESSLQISKNFSIFFDDNEVNREFIENSDDIIEIRTIISFLTGDYMQNCRDFVMCNEKNEITSEILSILNKDLKIEGGYTVKKVSMKGKVIENKLCYEAKPLYEASS